MYISLIKCVSECAKASSCSTLVESRRWKMHKITLFILAAVFAVALAEGQYYVPRAYYTIDAEGHESARVPLRRLRRSLQPYPYGANANANAQANANAYGGGSASANAEANARAVGGGGWGNGGWGVPGGSYGSSNPALRH